MNAGRQDDRFQGSDTPTPPVGLPLGHTEAAPEPPPGDAPTPPTGIEGLPGVVNSEDFGSPSPAVLGGDQSDVAERGDAGEWPTLEYRSRNKPEQGSGALGWLRRRRDDK